MTTNPDFFNSIEEFKQYIPNNSNSRYKNFKQTHFTAGDEEQFYSNRNYENLSFNNISLIKKNVFYDYKFENVSFDKYQNLNLDDVNNTFRYIFNKFKKGIYIKIKDNVLKTFLPFSKVNYINEWEKHILYDKTRWKSMIEFIIYCASQQGIKIDEKRVNKFVNTWYANNFLLRPEFPTGEGDSGVSNIHDMLLELCKSRKVPDIEVFINRRDNPILKKDGTEPYDSIFNEEIPLLSHSYDKYLPILSMVTTDKYADIPIPTIEDWARVSSISDNKFFNPPRDFKYNFSKSFNERKSIAVFRGASTGEGTSPETNMRIKISLMSNEYPDLLDAGITKWNTRPRKEFGKKFLTTIEHQKYNISLANFLTPEEQANYKYIVNIDGHVTAYRLGLELMSGSVVLLVKSKYRIWYSRLLEPYIHYVPIKEDLSDLIEQIKWCKDNDKKCEEIAKNAKRFYDKFLTKNGTLDYLQSLFFNLKKSVGCYFDRIISVSEICRQEQLKMLNDVKMREFKDINFLDEIRSEKTLIKEFQVDDNIYIHKTSTQQDEIINEAFIGFYCVNEMSKFIPNFMKIYNFNKDTLISEKVEGILFSEWIEKSFNMIQYLWIILQLSLILEFSQNFCMFNHRDLYTWNIIIKSVESPIEISYPVFGKGVYKIKTDLYPVIIDYGKSKVQYKDTYYGLNNINNYYPFQDCIIILLSSIYNIFALKLGSIQIDMIFKISKIFLNTNSLTELKTFVRTKKKYNEVMYNNDDLYKEKTPMDLFDHIWKLMNLKSKNWKVDIIDKYIAPYTLDLKGEEFESKDTIGEDIESLYYLSLIKGCNKTEEINWNGLLFIEKPQDLNLYDNIFYNEDKLEKNIIKKYKGNKTSSFLYKIFDIIYIENVFEKKFEKTYKKNVLKNLNYKKFQKWICDTSSLNFYGRLINEEKMKLI